jgi:4-diphosphocytidyl-2-C-methyl-D-erythritol kinase
VNLFLQVLGRRQDGYHDLRTLMVSLQLFDTLSFEPVHNEEITLSCLSARRGAADLPAHEQNLVVRAARQLQKSTGCRRGARISLWKRIPSEAGLGGGSSDAAATLVALNRLWNLDLSCQELHAQAAQLGSDVNFFLESHPAAMCTARGEIVHPVPLAVPLHFVLARPASGLSTAKVFQNLLIDTRSERSEEELLRAMREGRSADIARQLVNDLKEPAQKINGEVDGVLKKLASSDALGCGMTGSGSACFAICRTARHALALAGRCRNWGIKQVFAVSSGV